MRTRPWSIALLCLLSSAAAQAQTSPSTHGRFSPPFAEPDILGQPTPEKCIPDGAGDLACKPAAGTISLLPDGRYIYFNALEGTENIELSLLLEFGVVSVNDQTRVLSFGADGTPSWLKPTPNDGGANPNGNDPDTLPGGLNDTGQHTHNDGALFCADVAQLPDGRLVAVGGTDYYTELGIVELEGLKNTRIFDYRTNTWHQTGSMNYGRWYPSVVTLANSELMVLSGVTKLLKPVYPEEPLQSGRNVVQTETFSLSCGTWSDNGPMAQRTLPLYPRVHLLPNGHVYFNSGGQAFNPFGQSYDQALWNLTATYDPVARQWTDLGYAGLPLTLNQVGLGQLTSALNPTGGLGGLGGVVGGLLGTVVQDEAALAGVLSTLTGMAVDPSTAGRVLGSGFRGSTFSIMLPLKPDALGRYPRAEFLTAGGVHSGGVATSPGLYFATNLSRIDTVDVAASPVRYGSRLTGALNKPRWYGSAVLLPDGTVFTVSGGDRDGVAMPGLEVPVTQAELFDPRTETWRPVANQINARTYHNTALLMPDGRVLVGGHSPIATAYMRFIDLEALGFAPYSGRDPSFEIYSPPYVFRGDRPTFLEPWTTPRIVERGGTLTFRTPQALDLADVRLVRNTDTTHLIDADQRTVILPVLGRGLDWVTVRIPSQAAVLPAGHYMLFINRATSDGPVPSRSLPIRVRGATVAPCATPAP